jgi:hypothetical protein
MSCIGGKTFSDYSGHPNIAVPIEQGPNAGKSSSAAGRYQFLGSTWGDIANRYGLPDFSPTSQDQGAWALANENYRKTTGGDLATDLQAGKVQQVAEALSPTWTSLAGGIEAQPGGTGAPLAAAFQAGLPDPAVPVTTPPTPSPGLLSMAPTPEAAAATAATDQASTLKGLLAPAAPTAGRGRRSGHGPAGSPQVRRREDRAPRAPRIQLHIGGEHVRYDWSITATNNQTADAAINWQEGQNPSTVNDSARAMMAQIALWRNDMGGGATVGGTANAITLTLGGTMAAYTQGILSFLATATNTGATTMKVDGTTAIPLRIVSGDDLTGGEIDARPGLFLRQEPVCCRVAAGRRQALRSRMLIRQSRLLSRLLRPALLVSMRLYLATISAGTGLSGGGTLAADRTISLANTAVTPGAYTAANVTVDAAGPS